MPDNLRDRITKVLIEAAEFRGVYQLHNPDMRFMADAVLAALPELNPDHIRRKYLKDWEEGYDEGYSAGGGGC